MPIPIAVVGLGKIAHDQHLPTLAASADFTLAASVSRHARVNGVANFADLATAFEARPDIEAVALCTPPVGRHRLARAALAAGRHVLLEKPPGAALAEVADLAALAAARGLSLFASWHARCADAIEPARAWLAGRRVRRVQITWKEDVRQWHPGQDWIFAPGGMGVFDPGINALSIATRILPRPFMLSRARLDFPAGRGAPIAADLVFEDADGAPITAAFDLRQAGLQSWDIAVETDAGRLRLESGGARLIIDGRAQPLETGSEYARLYARFAELVRTRASEADTSPLVHVADAFMLGERREVEPFHW